MLVNSDREASEIKIELVELQSDKDDCKEALTTVPISASLSEKLYNEVYDEAFESEVIKEEEKIGLDVISAAEIENRNSNEIELTVEQTNSVS